MSEFVALVLFAHNLVFWGGVFLATHLSKQTTNVKANVRGLLDRIGGVCCYATLRELIFPAMS